MTQPIETEIKLAASPAILGKLRSHPLLTGPEQTTTLISIYYDTSDGRLQRCGAALRVRECDQGREQTLKLAFPGGATIQRREWTVKAPCSRPVISRFPAKPRMALTRLLSGEALAPIATNRIERTRRRIDFRGSAIEVAFDLGTIEVAGREEAVFELEIELLNGRLADAIALVSQLPLGPELNWSVRSKADRCYQVALDRHPPAVHGTPVKLTPAMSVGMGFQVIAWNCLGQLLANYPLVVEFGDPEAIHQSRVAIRRLRAAISLKRSVVDDEQAPILQSELKAVALELGRSRDLRVLIDGIAVASRTNEQDAGILLHYLGERMDVATRSAQVLLASASFQRLLFQLAAWIEDGDWTRRSQGTDSKRSLRSFASRALSRQRRKIGGLIGTVATMSPATRHKLRKNAKKFRYSLEFFASLYRGRKLTRQRRELVQTAKNLQDELGRLNDMAVAATTRQSLFQDLDPITSASLATQLDELLADQQNSRVRLLKAASASLERITGADAWWKAK